MLKLRRQYFGHMTEKPTHWKRLWYYKGLSGGGWGGNNEHEFEQIWGDSKGQGSLVYTAVHGVTKSQTQLSDWTTATLTFLQEIWKRQYRIKAPWRCQTGMIKFEQVFVVLADWAEMKTIMFFYNMYPVDLEGNDWSYPCMMMEFVQEITRGTWELLQILYWNYWLVSKWVKIIDDY